MRFPLATVAVVLAVLSAAPPASPDVGVRMKESNAWIKAWRARDRSIWPAVHVAARIFKVSEPLMITIVGREGGNVNPGTLARSLCSSSGIGWNNHGSAAFGPFQFMMGYRGACFRHSAWGTFGSYDDAAFKDAKRRAWPVPYRFKHPASNVGQAITAAYMLANGGLSHWCASMC